MESQGTCDELTLQNTIIGSLKRLHAGFEKYLKNAAEELQL